MGLDMYLTAKRYLFDFVEESKEIKAKVDAALSTSLGSVKEVSLEVGYWRKANAIHQWFVTNAQDGVDECQETWLDRPKLQQLLDVVTEALADRDRAAEILPPASGFFFGSTDVDEWYFQDLEYTKQTLEKVLTSPDFEKWDFYYQSSW